MLCAIFKNLNSSTSTKNNSVITSFREFLLTHSFNLRSYGQLFVLVFRKKLVKLLCFFLVIALSQKRLRAKLGLQ